MTPAGFDSYSALAAKAPRVSSTSTENCPHDSIDWGPEIAAGPRKRVLEGSCVQCGGVVRGEELQDGSVVRVRRVD